MIEVDKPYGIMFDSDGNPVFAFSNWDTSDIHPVPDDVDERRDPRYTAGDPLQNVSESTRQSVIQAAKKRAQNG